MARIFFSGHNYQINLEDGQEGAEYYQPTMAFLRQSRLNHVLTHAPVICEPYLVDFWQNIRYGKRPDGVEVIRSRVGENDIEFSAEDLRDILELGSVEQEGGVDGLYTFNRSIIIGGLRRMGFAGDMNKATLFKKGFYGRWRYLAHVLLVGLSNKKSGWDTLNQETQSQMVALVYNKPYSFSKFFINEFRKQITARANARFLMYPRLIAMILNRLLPNLGIVEPVRRVSTLIKRSYSEFITRYPNDPNAQDVNPFGALININFPTPTDDVIADIVGHPVLHQPQQQQQPPPSPPHQQPPPSPPHQQPPTAAVIQQLDVMLEEQAAHPQLAQAMVHEVLEEVAPTNDPIADVEAFHESDSPGSEFAVDVPPGPGRPDVPEGDKRGKGIDEGPKEIMEVADSSSDDDDDDDDQGFGTGESKLIQVGSKMVSKGASSTGRRHRDSIDPDYQPEETTPETPVAKKARVTTEEISTVKSVPVASLAMPYPYSVKVKVPVARQFTEPSLSKAADERLQAMEAQIKMLSDQMAEQRESHAKEVEELKKRNAQMDAEMRGMRQLLIQLSQKFDEDRARIHTLEVDTSYRQAVSQHRLDVLAKRYQEMDQDGKRVAYEVFSTLGAHSRGLSSHKTSIQWIDQAFATLTERLGMQPTCRDDPLRSARREDGNDDPDAAQPRHTTRTPIILGYAPISAGTSSSHAGTSDKGKAPVVETEANPGLIFISSSPTNTSSSSDNSAEQLRQEIRMKFGNDFHVVENMYIDLVERSFQEEEVQKPNVEPELDDSLSSSDSEYDPEKDD